MRSPLLVPVVALTLVLAACAPSGGGGTGAPDPTPTASVTPEAPTATAVVVSLEGIAIVDQEGEPIEATRFDDPEPVLFLLDELLGSTPEPTEYPEYGTTTYEWGDDLLFGTTGPEYSWVRINVAELGGLPVQTSEGIQVGSSRDDLLTHDTYDGDYDVDGDGDSDFYGLEPVENSEYESLSFPGQPGTDFIEVQLEDDVVSSLRSPSNDYTDV